MSETKFTPGPWKAVIHSWGEAGVYSSDDRIAGLDVRHVATEETQDTFTELMEANAAIMAASPDLYAALKDLDDAFCSENRTKEDRLRSRQALIAARAALAKARGES